MATISTSPVAHPTATAGVSLLVSLPPLAQGSFEETLHRLSEAFAGTDVLLATPDAGALEWSEAAAGLSLKAVGYTPAAASTESWTLTAADFLNAHELSVAHRARAVLILGPEAQSLTSAGLRALAKGALEDGADLVAPRYALPARMGLVNSAILYPVSRALFGAAPRFPLALDWSVSARMAERLATVAQPFTAANQPEALVWPVAEAAVANYAIAEVDVGARVLPQPAAPDLNILLAQVAGSLFGDVDAKAAFWQRSRVAQSARPISGAAHPAVFATDEVQGMIESFRLAYGSLSEIWSLVLPPQSLLGLKRMSVMAAEQFSMPDSLWARIVYDFLLAYRLRTINRGHLLGALTPLYLAWVASHILRTSAGQDSETQIEAVAAAFEMDKPYLVSRWRWPDRFNP